MKNTRLPPYISVSGFESTMKVVEKLKKGNALTGKEMNKTGLPRNMQYQAVNALKFLGVVDDKGKLTEKRSIFLEKKPDQVRKLVKERYAPLLKSLKTPADRKDVIKAIRKVYNCGVSVAPLAATFFAWATETSEMNVMGRGTRKGGRRKKERPSTGAGPAGRKGARGRPGRPPGATKPRVVYSFNFQIDSKTTKNQIKQMIENVEESVPK